MRVLIAGKGVVTGIGNNTEENFRALCEKRDGIGPISLVDTRYKDEIPVAEVKLSDAELKNRLGLTSDTYTRTTLLGMLAAKEAWDEAGISQKGHARIGLISATTVAGMSKSELFYDRYRDSDFKNEYINTHEAAVSSEKIAAYLGISHFVTTISTACSSSANAVMLAARMIKQGQLDVAVAGGTDSLSKFTLNGFNTLKILDRNACRPMDKNRAGLNLGEGAAYLVLVSEQYTQKHGCLASAELTGYGNANDAYHQTASSPEGDGARMAMQEALLIAQTEPTSIDYINLHGTGTENNDLTESIAVKAVFGEKLPPVSSTKTYTGHTLAAAGAVEAVYSLLSLQHSLLFPNLRFSEPIEVTGIIPLTDIISDVPVRQVLSNSFGFGGNCTALIFSQISTIKD